MGKFILASGPIWSDEDKDYLRRVLPTAPRLRDVAEHLGRPPLGVKKMARKLGIERNPELVAVERLAYLEATRAGKPRKQRVPGTYTCKRYTDAENDRLCREYRDHPNIKELAREMGRPYKGLRKHATHALGLQRSDEVMEAAKLKGIERALAARQPRPRAIVEKALYTMPLLQQVWHQGLRSCQSDSPAP